MKQDSNAGSADSVKEHLPAERSSRQGEIEVRSRDAFELLKLGEAIVTLQADMRNLRLEKEDLRFERNRYSASAAQNQLKLTRALDELERMRVYRDEADTLRREVVALARECEERLGHERAAAGERNRQIDQALSDQAATLAAGYETRLLREKAVLRAELRSALTAEHDDRMRHEIVSLAKECAVKLAGQAEAIQRAADQAEAAQEELPPEPSRRERWKLL